MVTTKIAIVGTAGRGKDQFRMTRALFDTMLAKARTIIREKLNHSAIHLISGGAAWSGLSNTNPFISVQLVQIFILIYNIVFQDHIAVRLFLEFIDEKINLTLHLPCGWDDDKKQFVDNGNSDWRVNPGRSANRYHRQFGTKSGRNSLNDIHLVLQAGACAKVHSGFHKRNTEIAKTDILLAFSWSSSGFPVDGGTADTWKKSRSSKKIHVNLSNL